jgi:hemoglobin
VAGQQSQYGKVPWAKGVMATEFKKSLDKFKVPAAEQKELFDVIGTTKADIVAKQ